MTRHQDTVLEWLRKNANGLPIKAFLCERRLGKLRRQEGTMDKRQLELELQQADEEYKAVCKETDDAIDTAKRWSAARSRSLDKKLALDKKLKELDKPQRGKLCMFSDEGRGYANPMIRPFSYKDEADRYFAEDWDGKVIGHGWTNCRPVKLHELLGRIQGTEQKRQATCGLPNAIVGSGECACRWRKE